MRSYCRSCVSRDGPWWKRARGRTLKAFCETPYSNRRVFDGQGRGENRSLREVLEEAVKRAPNRLLIVLDQFEEFLILAKPENQREFATFIDEPQFGPIKDFKLLLVLRSDYQTLLEDAGLPLARAGETRSPVFNMRPRMHL
jgi:hypothetical protein